MKKKCGTHFLAILKLPRIRAKNWIFCRVLDVFVRCFSQICKQGTEYFLTLQTRTPNIPEKRYFPGKTVFLKILFCWSKTEFSQRADSKIHTRNSRVPIQNCTWGLPIWPPYILASFKNHWPKTIGCAIQSYFEISGVMTMLLLNGNRFNVPKWRMGKMDAEMAEEDWGCYRLRCVRVGMAAASYFFPEIAYKCCKVQRTCKEERVATDPLSVEIAVRITG